jgi:hypothetical protein
MEGVGASFPQKQRTRHSSPFQLTARDMNIIEAVHRYRMLERNQVEQLFFARADGPTHTNTNRSRERLRLLYRHGYLERILRPIHPLLSNQQGPVYRLAARGAKLLAERSGVPLSHLGGSVWTENLERGEAVARRIETGAVFINGLVKSDPRLPFGGIKKSGYGRELAEFGIREFVNIKTIWIA